MSLLAHNAAMNIDQAIRRAIAKSGQTRYRIAVGAGVDHAVLRRYLDEHRDIRLSTAERLVGYFGIKVSHGRENAK